jgi:transposase
LLHSTFNLPGAITALQSLSQEKRIKQLEEELNCSRAQAALYKKKYEESVQAYDCLLLAFKQLQRRTFGSSSERFIDSNVSQADFFSSVPVKELDHADKDNDADTSSNTSPPSNQRKRQKRAPKNRDFAKNLPRREVIVAAEDKQDGDRFIRYESTELLNYIPPVYEIIVLKREIWAHQASDASVKLIVAANPLRLLPQAKVTESFLAHMIVSKLYDRQPLYHLEKQFRERFEFICPRDKLARWFIQSAERLQPLVNLLCDELLDYDLVGCDPTHLQVLREPNRPAQKKSYVYSMRGGGPARAIRLFVYHAEDHALFLQNWFAGYRGYLQVDGQNIFTDFEYSEDVQLAFCHSHARRKFEPIAKAARKHGLANQAMTYYRALYKIEREAKDLALNADERYALRQAKSKPIVDEMFTWMKKVAPTTLPKSPLGVGFQYVLVRETGLRQFLNDGRLEIDTNLVEQQNKNLALARNNFMFSCSVKGAHALCLHMSLVFTALAHHLDPYHYYTHIMARIPHCQTVEDYEALLPWHCQESIKNKSSVADETS